MSYSDEEVEAWQDLHFRVGVLCGVLVSAVSYFFGWLNGFGLAVYVSLVVVLVAIQIRRVYRIGVKGESK